MSFGVEWQIQVRTRSAETSEMKDQVDKHVVEMIDSAEQIHLVIPAQPAMASEERLTDRLTAGCRCVAE